MPILRLKLIIILCCHCMHDCEAKLFYIVDHMKCFIAVYNFSVIVSIDLFVTLHLAPRQQAAKSFHRV